MQISEKLVKETIAFIVDSFRRSVSACSTYSLLDIHYRDAASKFQALRFLFIDYPDMMVLLDAAVSEILAIQVEVHNRLLCGSLVA